MAAVQVKEEPINVSFGEHSEVYLNGIRDHKLEQKCFVDVSQSSCDYSLSQFRADESSFHIKAEVSDDDDNSRFGTRFSHQNNIQNSTTVAEQSDDEEDIPIAMRKQMKREISEDEEDVPLAARKKVKTEKKAKKKKREESDYDDEEDYDDKPKKKKVKKEKVSF